jgi:uncharacterized membrane protein YeaQ/YmgE (transglycosylase-associated protein family)
MAIIPWVVLGLIADLIAGSFLNESGEGIELDIVLAIVGAVTGGFLCSLLGDAAGNEFNNHDTIVAVSGAIVALAVHHNMFGRVLVRRIVETHDNEPEPASDAASMSRQSTNRRRNT